MTDAVLAAEQPIDTRRERKKRATRLALKAAALDLVGERGYPHVTVEDIADVVDVSVRTFFNYFPSKDAAIVGEDPERTEATRRELLEIPSDVSPFDALRQVLLSRLEAIGEDIDLSGEDHEVWIRRFAVVKSQPEVMLAYAKHLATVERTLTDAMVERLGDEKLRAYASLVTAVALSVMRVAGSYWGGAGGTDALIDFSRAAFDVLGAGLAGETDAVIARASDVIGFGEACNRKEVAL
jgi:AcrR family transcriptional regulator